MHTSRLAAQISCAHNLAATLTGIPRPSAFRVAWEALADCDDDCLRAIGAYFSEEWGTEEVRIQLENLVNEIRDSILDGYSDIPQGCGPCGPCTIGGLCEYSKIR